MSPSGAVSRSTITGAWSLGPVPLRACRSTQAARPHHTGPPRLGECARTIKIPTTDKQPAEIDVCADDIGVALDLLKQFQRPFPVSLGLLVMTIHGMADAASQ